MVDPFTSLVRTIHILKPIDKEPRGVKSSLRLSLGLKGRESISQMTS